MDLSAMKDLYIGSTPVQSAWLGGTKVWERKPPVDVQAIKDAMLLWYDLKRQGATNENMRENPVLTDLSGNGHEATCYNFAWSGMSGIGGYATNFNSDSTRGEMETLGTQKWIVKNVTQDTSIPNELILQSEKNFTGFEKTVTVRVSGIDENNRVYIRYVGLNQLLHNGDNTVTFPPKRTIEEGDQTMHWVLFNFSRDCTNITIEILPEYPNALVADGVDDYVKVEGTPILTDYTVIAKRNYIEINKDTCLASKSTSGGIGAFIFEEKYSTNPSTVYSFGKATEIQFNENEIVYMTPISYNGVFIRKGSSVDTNTLYLGTLRNDTRKFNGALYSFILFNRTLTEEEINWVKTNLIEGDTEL